MATVNCEGRLAAALGATQDQLRTLYYEYARELGQLLKNYSGNMSTGKKEDLDKMLRAFERDLFRFVEGQIDKGNSLADICATELTVNYLVGSGTPSLFPNEEVAAIIEHHQRMAARQIKQISLASDTRELSKRVWKISKQTNEGIMHILKSGVVDGRSAKDMTKDLRQYLIEPDRRYRRVRNKAGKLVLSNPAKDYHPGQGVYRSSYKNALRLSRTEVNMAYRRSDFVRRQQMDFVTGHRVQLSAQHPRYDICDEMVGTYPKDFVFTGWHPQCLCYCTAITMPREKYKEYLSTGKMDNRHMVKKVPKRANDYIKANADTIKGYKSEPYFLRDNKDFFDY